MIFTHALKALVYCALPDTDGCKTSGLKFSRNNEDEDDEEAQMTISIHMVA